MFENICGSAIKEGHKIDAVGSITVVIRRVFLV